MKPSIVAGLVALTIAAPVTPQGAFPSPFFFAVAAIPQIHCIQEGGRGWSGTGVRISDDIILSARHVTDGKASCRAGAAMLTQTNSEGDFAANRGALGGGLRLVISCAGIREGEDYFGAGYGFGGELVMERLTGTSKRDGKFVTMNGRVYGGMSGGPVIDGQGRVVAIINQRLTEVSAANVHQLKDSYLCR